MTLERSGPPSVVVVGLTSHDRVDAREPQSPVVAALVVVALLFAFSPALVDLAVHMRDHAWARASLIFAALYASLRRRPHIQAQRRADGGWGGLAIGAGLLIELAAIAGGVVRLSRLGLLLALIGAARTLDRMPLRVAFLLVWLVPLPHKLVSLASPWLESGWAAIGVAAAGLFGLPLSHSKGVLAAPGTELALQPVDGGLALAWLLAGIAAFVACAAGVGARAQLAQMASWAIGAIPLQAALVVLVALALAAGLAAAPLAAVLAWLPCIAVVGLGLAHAVGARRRAPAPASDVPRAEDRAR